MNQIAGNPQPRICHMLSDLATMAMITAALIYCFGFIVTGTLALLKAELASLVCSAITILAGTVTMIYLRRAHVFGNLIWQRHRWFSWIVLAATTTLGTEGMRILLSKIPIPRAMVSSQPGAWVVPIGIVVAVFWFFLAVPLLHTVLATLEKG